LQRRRASHATFGSARQVSTARSVSAAAATAAKVRARSRRIFVTVFVASLNGGS